MAPRASGFTTSGRARTLLLLAAVGLQLAAWRAGDNHLKCLCFADELLLPRATQLSTAAAGINNNSSAAAADDSTQVIGSADNGGPQQLDFGGAARDEAPAEETEGALEGDNLTTNDLRATKWQVAKGFEGRASVAKTTTRRAPPPPPPPPIAIIDNQEAARAETNPLIERARHYSEGASFLPKLERKKSATSLKCPPPPPSECPATEGRAADRKLQVCASNGRVYSSACAMHRSACELGLHLRRMRSHARCERNYAERRLDYDARLEQLDEDDDDAAGCLERADYAKFKAALWREFGGDLKRLFKRLDANADQTIEARELWPRQEGDGASICSSSSSNSSSSSAANCKRDLAFEPHFSWSTCSLSHLMVFELAHTGDTFSWPAFERAFSQLETPAETTTPAEAWPSNEIRTSRQTDTTKLNLSLGDSQRLACLSSKLEADLTAAQVERRALSCAWRRHGVSLASLRDEHVQLVARSGAASNQDGDIEDGRELDLELRDAQLYLSGAFECACRSEAARLSLVHKYQVQVTAPAHVSVRPPFQWSPPNSRVSFECRHESIDTGGEPAGSSSSRAPPIEWLKTNEESGAEGRLEGATATGSCNAGAHCAQGAAVVAADGRLVLEGLQLNDTGEYKCRLAEGAPGGPALGSGRLLVREQPPASAAAGSSSGRHLWHFHAGGISVFELVDEQLELVRELSGHEQVSARVDGNWNQLTLCGGLAPEQAVICEWSDNALELRVPPPAGGTNQEFQATSTRDNESEESNQAEGRESRARSFIYVGQPNLNRLLVLDGRALTIVAVVNTEPQPRRLFAYRPNRIHLNKWVRRRLSPLANARWLQAVAQAAAAGQRAHPLELTPKASRLYSDKRGGGGGGGEDEANERQEGQQQQQQMDDKRRAFKRAASAEGAPRLVQHDIWLLCYGQPLVVDPAREEAPELEGAAQMEWLPLEGNRSAAREGDEANWRRPPLGAQRAATWRPLMQAHYWREAAAARLRNRKSIQIIQSTFFERPRWRRVGHRHANQAGAQEAGAGLTAPMWQDELVDEDEERAVSEFKRLSVLTTHYVMASAAMRQQQLLRARPRARRDERRDGGRMQAQLGMRMQNYPPLQPPPLDLVQDLSVPSRPQWLADDARLKLHFAYATHHADQRLSRISMDSYHYDRQIDLLNCRAPSNLLATQQGQLVLQCAAPAAGQLVLDELTGARVQFNANICAQASYLSPDSRYLVSVYTNQSAAAAAAAAASTMPAGKKAPSGDESDARRDFKRSTIIYVQLVAVDGLALQYEIKTALEIVQCAFVWKDGYYAAIFVALNRRDQQSELLSLRLADSRLELMVRLPGLAAPAAPARTHREPLNVLEELKMAALSTSEATYIVDLNENRIIQTLAQHHQSSPTLLWA